MSRLDDRPLVDFEYARTTMSRERIVLEVDGVRVHVPEGVDASTLRTMLEALLESSEAERRSRAESEIYVGLEAIGLRCDSTGSRGWPRIDSVAWRDAARSSCSSASAARR